MPQQDTSRFLASVVVSAVLTLSAAPLAAQTAPDQPQPIATVQNANFVEDESGGQRVNLSGKLRMLSQRIPAAACNLNAGIVPEQSAGVLDGAVAEFQSILAALEFGDDALGINSVEERPRILRILQEMHIVFAPLDAAVRQAQGGTPTADAIQVLADNNMNLLEVAKLLVSEISATYSNPAALLQADALAIDIAGRQRMLTQKTSKEICFILSGFNTDQSQNALGGTIGTFEASLDALRNGMPSVGIQEPPTEEIAQGLDVVIADWSAVKLLMNRVQAGETLTPDERAEVFLGLNKTMADMNAVVGLYASASDLGL